MQTAFPLVSQSVAELTASAGGTLRHPVPFEKYPHADREVLTLLHYAISLRLLSEKLTDAATIKHIVDHTPEDYASNLIAFGLCAAPAATEKVWETQIERRFPNQMAAARIRNAENVRARDEVLKTLGWT